MKFFRIDDQQVVTTPVIVGTDEEVRDACLCSHSDWEDAASAPGLVPDGVMQKCSNCTAIRYVFDEFPDDVGIEVVEVSNKEYRELVYVMQQAMLLSKFKRESV